MKLLIIIFLLGGPCCFAQDMYYMIKDAERHEAKPDEKAAFLKYKEALKQQPSNVYILTKCSELCSRIGNREVNTTSRDNYYREAIMYGSTALKYQPNNDEANVAMAIALGRTLLVKSGREKVKGVKEIKRYADNALRVNAKNFKAWHVLGKWNYEVSNLNLMERAATNLLYGGLPGGSLKNSIAAYEKARILNPNFMLNYLELGKAYNRNDEKINAIIQLKTLLTLPVKTEDDPRIKREAKKLLADWE